MKRETKQSFDGQLCQEYSHQKVLKLDHFSSSYDETKFGMFLMSHSVVTAYIEFDSMSNGLYSHIAQIVKCQQQKSMACDCITDEQLGNLSQVIVTT